MNFQTNGGQKVAGCSAEKLRDIGAVNRLTVRGRPRRKCWPG